MSLNSLSFPSSGHSWTDGLRVGRNVRSLMLRSVSSQWTRLMRYFVPNSSTETSTDSTNFTLVIIGGSGDLATAKLLPALWSILARDRHFPVNSFTIVAYARTAMTTDQYRDRVKQIIRSKNGAAAVGEDDAQKRSAIANEELFFAAIHYVVGEYHDPAGYERMNTLIDTVSPGSNRVFYLALPPDLFVVAAKNAKDFLYANPPASNRVVVETPFGRDVDTAMALNVAIGFSFNEEEIFRIDHYLGKEMVKNLMVLRFANPVFSSVWDRHHVSNVQITFKESSSRIRSTYFDSVGIIREIMVSHLMQILSIICMDKPVSVDPEDVRNEKVKVLRRVRPVGVDDVLLGQYDSYLDEGETRSKSTPTFAAAVLHVMSERWEGVPFIVRCGKAMNEDKVEIRLQMRDVAAGLYSDNSRNELVIRVQPREAVYMKISIKEPGLSSALAVTELDLSLPERYSSVKIPEAYESLLVDIFKGDNSNFVRDDELEAAWRIFSPVLDEIERLAIQPLPYARGSRGPDGVDDFLSKRGDFVHGQGYHWKKQ